MARTARFELATGNLVGTCSVQLSYVRHHQRLVDSRSTGRFSYGGFAFGFQRKGLRLQWQHSANKHKMLCGKVRGTLNGSVPKEPLR